MSTAERKDGQVEPENTMEHAAARLLDAAVAHVPFEGWSEATLKDAAADSGCSPDLARALYPRGGVDLARAWHLRGDAAMIAALRERDLTGLKMREKITLALRLRLEGADRELVRRGTTLFALPNHAAEGAGLIWATADAVWNALGDTSRDANWYTKRATLSAVYGATVLFCLGDTSEGAEETWHFLDRRIANVMDFERAKASWRQSSLAKGLAAGPLKILERIRAPERSGDLPGSTARRSKPTEQGSAS